MASPCGSGDCSGWIPKTGGDQASVGCVEHRETNDLSPAISRLAAQPAAKPCALNLVLGVLRTYKETKVTKRQRANLPLYPPFLLFKICGAAGGLQRLEADSRECERRLAIDPRNQRNPRCFMTAIIASSRGDMSCLCHICRRQDKSCPTTWSFVASYRTSVSAMAVVASSSRSCRCCGGVSGARGKAQVAWSISPCQTRICFVAASV